MGFVKVSTDKGSGLKHGDMASCKYVAVLRKNTRSIGVSFKNWGWGCGATKRTNGLSGPATGCFPKPETLSPQPSLEP